jgi:riboflavin synthase
MFTGIIEELGEIINFNDNTITINGNVIITDLHVKDSVSVNGVCLTVIAIDGQNFQINVVPETLNRSNLGSLSKGDMVNLERSLQFNGRIGGHFVQGHVDGTGQINSISEDQESVLINISVPDNLSNYIVEKGYISVDGASLTVVKCDLSSFKISLIPYTRKYTILGNKNIGDTVNLEVDILGKYIERFVESRLQK